MVARKLPRFGMFRTSRPDLKIGDRVRVIVGSKEVERSAEIVALPDSDFVTTRTVKVLIEGEKEARKISLDRVISKT